MGLADLKAKLNTGTTEAFLLGLSGKDATIEVSNSFSAMVGFSDAGLEFVKSILTYDNQEVIYQLQQVKIQLGMAFRYKNYKRVNWLKTLIADLEANTRICWLKGNKFPTGHLPLVTEALQKAAVSFHINELRRNTAPQVKYTWATPPLEPRYFQNDMVELGVTHHRGVFESAVGTGKTYVTQLLIHRLQVPTIVILPSKDLSIQTYNSFVDAFGSASVELIDSAKKIATKKPIKICTVHTVTGALKKGGIKTLLANIGMLCIDEVHHAGAKSYTDLLTHFDHIYYRFGFSGTFMRNDSKTMDMWGFLSSVLYRYSAAKATKEGFLTPMKVIVHEIDGARGSNYQGEYKKNYCKSDDLLFSIEGILQDFVDPGEQVLILVGRKEESGKVIFDYLKRHGANVQYVDGDSDRDYVKQALLNFNAKKTSVLIGSSIIGEGIDIRSTDHLIMCQGGKSEIAVTQAIGRAVRLYPGKKTAFVHDFRFNGTKYLEKHLGKRLEIYRKNFDGEVLC